MVEIKGEEILHRCFDPDVYWEMRGGNQYLGTLRDDHENVISVEKMFYRWIIAEADISSVLDFGCGTGVMFPAWERLTAVHAYDRSLSMINIAKSAGYDYNIRFRNGDPRTIVPYSDQQFDLVAACEVLPAIVPDEIGAMIEELHRVCRGYLGAVVTTPFKSETEWYFSHNYDELLKPFFDIKESLVVAPYRFIWAKRKAGPTTQ